MVAGAVRDAGARAVRGEDDDRLLACWWLLASTGMRRGEVLGLRWSDLDLDNARLSVNRTLVTTEARRAGQPGMAWSTHNLTSPLTLMAPSESE